MLTDVTHCSIFQLAHDRRHVAKLGGIPIQCIYNVETGTEIRTTIENWGNSRALRIPKELALESGLDFGSKVELIHERGALRIVPVKEPSYTLEELVAQISPENRHDEVDWGPPVGKEVW